MTRWIVTMLFVFGISGCCTDPWARFPNKRSPDLSYSIGSSVQGYDVYVWSCVDKQKIVVFQYSAEMSCQSPERQSAACGQETDFERQHQGSPRLPARPSRAWR